MVRFVLSFASTRFGGWFFTTVAPPIDRFLMKVSGGRLNTAMGLVPVLVLETVGRKSGKPRSAPLLFLRDGERYVVIASKGGAPKHPDWYWNLRANPGVRVVTGGQTIACRAAEAEGAERARLWGMATQVNPGFDVYQERAGRVIPVITLTPAEAAA